MEGAAGELRKGNLKKTGLTDKGFHQDRSFILVEIAGDEMYFQTVTRNGTTVDSGLIEKTTRGQKSTKAVSRGNDAARYVSAQDQ